MATSKTLTHEFFKGFWEVLPPFRLVLGLCPTLAVTTMAENGIGMGLATTFVLVFSNIIIASIKSIIPKKVRIASYIMVIATFVVIVELMMKAYFFSISEKLGIFIPLIVVNCIILGRAEAFASKNPVYLSAADGLGIGLGFTMALFLISSIREILGYGTVFGMSVMWEGFEPFSFMVQAPGAFVCLGILLAIINLIAKK
ncbi:MAG: electron transport complex subunit E [bacterium]|nr:electron transport complex subunit E [bacterium]